MQEVDWSNMGAGSKSGKDGGISFLRFESEKTYRIRPFGGAIQFYKLFIEKGKPSVAIAADEKDEAARILTEHFGREIKPSFKAAMFILDREDNKVKILEGGFQIFEAFSKWSQGSDINPGAADAGDWQIAVTGNGVGGSNPRKYSTQYIGPAPLSDDEKAMLTEFKAKDKLKLANYIKEVPLSNLLEEIGVAPKAAAGASSGDAEW